MAGWLRVSVGFPYVLVQYTRTPWITRQGATIGPLKYYKQAKFLEQVYITFIPLLHGPSIAMMFELIYGVASFIVIVIVMLIVLLCVFIMYLALTATLREHRAFLLESAIREKQQRVNRGQRELEADRRSNAEEERPREFARRRLPVQHDERRCLGVSIRFI